MNCHWYNGCEALSWIAPPLAGIACDVFMPGVGYGICGAIAGAVIAGLQYALYASPRPGFWTTVFRSMYIFAYNLIIGWITSMVSAAFVGGVFQSLGKVAVKVGDLPGLGFVERIGNWLMGNLGWKADVGKHSTSWLAKIFGI
jgi:hypothetical protein